MISYNENGGVEELSIFRFWLLLPNGIQDQMLNVRGVPIPFSNEALCFFFVEDGLRLKQNGKNKNA